LLSLKRQNHYFMKKIIILSVFTLFSSLIFAQNTYDKLWEKVTEYEKKGLPKSALSEVEKIYHLAKKNKDAAQIVKTILYKSKYTLTLTEDAQLKIITDIKKEISAAKSPVKNVLESILADLYWQYFNQNRWRFYNRSHTDKKIDTLDFRTWDLQTIFKEISIHHQKALNNALELQQIPIKYFNPILLKQKNSDKYRTTIYDFIVHNALKFYKTGERNLPQPQIKFEITDPKYLSDIDTFLRASFNSLDKESQKLQALRLFKDLTLFHKNDKDKTALIALTLERLDFVKSNARFDDKNQVYLQTLKNMQKQYRKLPIATEIDFRIADFYVKQAVEYTPKNLVNQFKYRNALEVCETAIVNYPNSSGALKCKNLKNRILAEKYNITSEIFIEENKNSFAKISYKNVAKLYFRIYKITDNQEIKLNQIYNYQEKLQKIKELQFVTLFEQKLKSVSDFQTHATEVVLPKLEQNRYLILASNNSDFTDFNSFSYNFITVTNIAYTETQIENQYLFQFVDRETGKPLSNLKVHIENSKISRYNSKIKMDLQTDENGFITISSPKNHSYVAFDVFKNSKKTTFKYFNFNRYYRNKDVIFQNKRIFLFTDRSIYRPGQTVYFKGIAISQEENKSHILTNERLTAILKDVNNQTVEELTFVTNEFGSFSGEFILPENGLTGNFTIQAKNKKNTYGATNFSVEEYKRPKFFAKFLPVTKNFKVRDSVLVTGQATAYAGSNISDAKVVYRVIRMVQYPKWFYWYRPAGIASEAQEITHGETKTNEKGEFNISFLAKPDLSVNRKQNPIFKYKITTDITDINGETRSTSTVVNVGYHSIVLDIDVDEKINKDQKNTQLVVKTTNLNGEKISATGKLKIYKVQTPKNVKRKRPWDAPDFPIISKKEFETLFPHDYYTDFIPFESLGELVFETNFNSATSEKITLPKIKTWQSGKYVVLAQTKGGNQMIKDKRLVWLYSEKDKKVADNQLFLIKTDNETYQLNEHVSLKIGSASKDISVLVQVEKDKKIVQTEVVHLSNSIKNIQIPVTKKDLGGFAIHYNYINFNSNKNGSILIDVPYPKTDLEIETITFKDKLQPNEEQTWSFKIKGKNKDKVVAEMLASMYDASLDQFKKHQWQFRPIYHKFYYPVFRNSQSSFGKITFITYQKKLNYTPISTQQYDQLNWFGFYFGSAYYGINPVEEDAEFEEVVVQAASPRGKRKIIKTNTALKGSVAGLQVSKDKDVNFDKEKSKKSDETVVENDFSPVKVRTNFKETAFFYPHLRTDKNGNIRFTFTTPESLTKWKIQLLAYDKELHFALNTLEAVTQKDLMVLPNAPRFLRQGDTLVFQTKIANISAKNLQGATQLQLFDALTDKDITEKLLKNAKNKINFSVKAKENTVVSYTINVPDNMQAVRYKIVAKAGNFSDGEQNILPVLTNRMLVTETLPMWIWSNQTKTFVFDKLKKNTSTSLKNFKLTLEVTSNPAWYAVQALPYLMEYPYECSEQTFSRYYANTLASHLANSNPKIQHVFNQWKNSDALLSNLEKNQELKSILIQETPWLREAESESEQKKRIALLFDLNKIGREQEKAIRKLKQMQMASGGFPWFNGGRYENRYITQHIVSGIGHLKKLGVALQDKNSNTIANKALVYLDNKILEDYNELLKQANRLYANSVNKEQEIKAFLVKNHTSNFQIHYLYTRSFYKDKPIPKKAKTAVDYYTKQAYKYWLNYSLYNKGLIALVANRNENFAVAEGILHSLQETSITDEELGMYWKENKPSYYWYQAPIETQALMVEVFTELKAKTKEIDNLRIWLLKNKQTNRWETTKATTEAIYALLLQGTKWIETTDFVQVKIGNQEIHPLQLKDTKVEAGTGYFKKSWNTNEITPKMAEVTLSKKGKGIAWAALYWQYFEDLDKITPTNNQTKTPLQIKKKLFLKTNKNTGEVIHQITDKTTLKVGDLIKVRIEIKADRAMEFIHLKDMRASGLEPVNVLSKYKWQDGLGYYESIKDASTNFFISYLPKGVFVFEYDLRVANAGNFSNGITTIQSMYAPEFASHSEGVRVKIIN